MIEIKYKIKYFNPKLTEIQIKKVDGLTWLDRPTPTLSIIKTNVKIIGEKAEGTIIAEKEEVFNFYVVSGSRRHSSTIYVYVVAKEGVNVKKEMRYASLFIENAEEIQIDELEAAKWAKTNEIELTEPAAYSLQKFFQLPAKPTVRKPRCKITISSLGIVIEGETYQIRDAIKNIASELGAKAIWQPFDKTWLIKSYNKTDLRNFATQIAERLSSVVDVTAENKTN